MKKRIIRFCHKCSRKVRTIRRGKGGFFLCWKCYRKETHIMPFLSRMSGMSFEKALNKTYEVKGYLTTRGTIRAVCCFPQILVGHKFKLQILDLEGEEVK